MAFSSTLILSGILLLFSFAACSQNSEKTSGKKVDKQETEHKDPLLCKPQEGICETPALASYETGIEELSEPLKQKIKIIYATDPICSACWGIEPQLRRLKLEYGNAIEIEYHMGGLLPSWEGFNGGGITKPSDVAQHWDEVSRYYQMPIDGKVWLTDPLPSSYPPSIAFKAAQLQDAQKAQVFLRKLREMVFIENLNIAKPEVILSAAKTAGLDVDRLQADLEGQAKADFQMDLRIVQQMGVRGFPTLIMINEAGQAERIVGHKAYQVFESSLLKLDDKITKKEYSRETLDLFKYFPTLTSKEFSELKGVSFAEAEKLLNELQQKGVLKVTRIKNGNIWSLA